jgi:hypothetical protein
MNPDGCPAGSTLCQLHRTTTVTTLRLPILAAMLPGLSMLGLFYSLVVHMRWRLGRFPESIGNHGFPASLSHHGEWTWTCVSVLTGGSLVAIPTLILVSLVVRRWRRWAILPVIHGLTLLAAWGLMLLAPNAFLHWWWD